MFNISSLKLKKYLFGYGMLLPAMLFFVLFVAYPSIEAVGLSFQRWHGYGQSVFIGFRNYVNLVQDPVFWAALKNNIIFVVATTALQTIIPMILATLLAKNNFINGFFRVGFFIPNIISFIITGSLWATIFEPNFGLLNTMLMKLGLQDLTQLWLASPKLALPCIIFVSLWQSMGFYLIIFFAGLQRIPGELYEVASVDGASPIKKFWYITVPLLKPVTLVVMVINIIGGFKVFDIVWAMTTGGPNHASEVMATYLYTTAFGNVGTGTPQMGYAASIGIIILVLSVVASVVNLKIGEAKKVEY